MSEAKWTKGPWAMHKMTREISVEAPCGRVLMLASRYGDKEIEHDARLISAAPELYSALEALLERAADELADPEDVHEISIARAALAKARGEQP